MAAIRIQTGLRMHQARRTAQGLREARVQTTAVTFLQSYMRGAATRSAMPRLQKQALEEKARRYTAAQMIQEQHRRKHAPAPGSGAAAGGAFDDTPLPAADAFVIRNLDTGEAVSLELGAEEGAQDKDLKLSFGTLQQNPQAWEALKADSKGAPPPHLEPMRGRATPSPPPAAAQACWRSSRHRPRSPSARTSCACGRSDTCTPLTTRSATSTSLPTCSRRAARSRSRTHRSSLLVRARALEPRTPAWAARLGCCAGQRKPQPVRRGPGSRSPVAPTRSARARLRRSV